MQNGINLVIAAWPCQFKTRLISTFINRLGVTFPHEQVDVILEIQMAYILLTGEWIYLDGTKMASK